MTKIFLGLFYRIFSSKKKQIYLERDEIRLSMHVLKNDLSDDQRNALADKVFSRVENLKQFQKAKKILIFWSKDLDIPTQNYILKWSEKKEIFLPSIRSNRLKIKKFVRVLETSKENSFHFDPKTAPYDGDIDLAIIPSVAFDNAKNRMGQGKGYYNGFLKLKSIYTIGVGYDFQVIDEIPYYWRDVKMDIIITPEKIII